MPKLNLPEVELKTKLVNGTIQVFDKVRKKYFVLTPEEWVRQNFINYLNVDLGYPISLLAVEKMVRYNSMKTRADIVVYNRYGDPFMIVECKSSSVKITQDAFNQIAKYNTGLKVNYLLITNGLQHFCCKMDYESNSYNFVDKIPIF